MDIGVISVRYARALLKAATNAGLEDTVYRAMQMLAQTYIDVHELRFTIDNPMLPKQKKKELLVTASGGKTSELVNSFFDLVLREDRESVIQFMANSYITLYRRQKNIIRGKLTTAVSVSSDIEKKMRTMVENRTNAAVEFETDVDPNIIGGFVLEYDTYRLDASVQSQLRNVLKQLKK
ncbi:MAG: F0F1 ATP synthase subunit delta [Prevotella sp.]